MHPHNPPDDHCLNCLMEQVPALRARLAAVEAEAEALRNVADMGENKWRPERDGFEAALAASEAERERLEIARAHHERIALERVDAVDRAQKAEAAIAEKTAELTETTRRYWLLAHAVAGGHTVAAESMTVEDLCAKARASQAERERLFDLVRHQRGELFREGLITKEEHLALVTTHGGVQRLEAYDALRARVAKGEAQISKLRRGCELALAARTPEEWNAAAREIRAAIADAPAPRHFQESGEVTEAFLREGGESVVAYVEALKDCHGGPGTTSPACAACITCLNRIIAALTEELLDVRPCGTPYCGSGPSEDPMRCTKCLARDARRSMLLSASPSTAALAEFGQRVAELCRPGATELNAAMVALALGGKP